MRWIVAQLGARQHYAVPVAFQRLGHLKLFYTEAWCRWGRELVRVGPSAFQAYANRFNPELPPSKVRSFTVRYAPFRLKRYPADPLSVPDLYRFYAQEGEWFSNRIVEDLSSRTFDPEEDHFFAFNTGALEALDLLRKRGVFTVLDQIDGGAEDERMVLAEKEKWPGWEDAPEPIPEEYWRRIRAEWQATDVIMVNSDWSKSLVVGDGAPATKLIVVPLAYERPYDSHFFTEASGPLTVLWLGRVALRKGIQYFFQAARLLPRVRFVVAGPLEIRKEILLSSPPNITFLGRIQRNDIARIYGQAHLFVLPTISDGFAIVQLEAMAHGLPVITTPNCGRVVDDGQDGIIVPAMNGEAIAAAIARLDANRKELMAMSRRAFDKAGQFELPKNAQQIEDAIRVFKSGRLLRQQDKPAETA